MTVTTPESTAREWINDGLVQGLATVLNMVGGVLVAVVATKSLSVDDFGVFAWATAAVTYLGFFGRFGGMQASTIVLSQTAAQDRHPRERAFLAVTLAGSMVVAGVWLVCVFVLDSATESLTELGVAPLLVGIWLPVTALVPTVGGVIRGRGHFRRSAVLSEYVRKATAVLVLIGFLLTDRTDLESLLIWIISLDLAVAGLALAFFGRPGFPSWANFKQCARESASFAVMSIGAASVPAAGIVAVGFLIDTDELALLGVAMRIFALVAAGYVVLVRVATPRIARAHSQGVLMELGPLIRRFAFVAVSAQILALVVFVAIGRPALRIVFGNFYEAAYGTTILLLVGSAVNTYFGPAMLTLTCTGDRWFVARARVISAIAFTIASIVLAVATGAIGIAICFVATITVFNLAMWRRAKRTIGLDTSARWERQGSMTP